MKKRVIGFECKKFSKVCRAADKGGQHDSVAHGNVVCTVPV